MCGIAGIYLRDAGAKADLDGILDTMLDEIEHRGGDATGFVALGNEGVTEWQKAACGAKDFVRYRRPVPRGTRTVLAHTRWATQGLPAFVENNHPLKRGSFFVIHNGHVSNDAKLFELANRSRFGQVDSEALPARFASLGSLNAAPKVMSEVEGAAAIAAVDEKKPTELLLARGYASPLFVLQTKRYVLWGSTPATIESAYKAHIGRLPKKARIKSIDEGTVLHYVDGKLTTTSFQAYKPAPIKVTTPITLPWKEIGTEVGIRPSTGSWDPEEDMLECDGCGEEVSWKDIEYQWDEEAHVSWQFCQNCDVRYEKGDATFAHLEARFEEVNEAILRDSE
jgi:asparagine synthetase B (glutamine-hydrolysing)